MQILTQSENLCGPRGSVPYQPQQTRTILIKATIWAYNRTRWAEWEESLCFRRRVNGGATFAKHSWPHSDYAINFLKSPIGVANTASNDGATDRISRFF
jgi:hypothetical protein